LDDELFTSDLLELGFDRLDAFLEIADFLPEGSDRSLGADRPCWLREGAGRP
jgi:hypothetical protein